MYRLIVCSVDDTLLNNNHVISKDTVEALLQAQRAGARLALITRRCAENLKHIAKQLHMEEYNGYIAACHGAYIQELGSHRVLSRKEISLDIVTRLLKLKEAHEVNLSIVENKRLYTTGNDPYVQLEALLNDMKLCDWNEFEDISDSVLKVYVTGESRALNGFLSWLPNSLKEEINMIQTGKNMVSIVAPEVNKGFALKTIMKDMNIVKDDVLLIADSENDQAMFAYAGNISVMENAAAAVKKSASFLTHSNNQDGIVRTLEMMTSDVEVI